MCAGARSFCARTLHSSTELRPSAVNSGNEAFYTTSSATLTTFTAVVTAAISAALASKSAPPAAAAVGVPLQLPAVAEWLNSA